MEILVTGDFNPSGRAEDLIKKNNYQKLFGNFLQIIQNADFSITNLEAPITLSIKPIGKTGPNLKAIKETAEFLKSATFDLLTLANNHILDYGKEGLIDTIIAIKENRLFFVGAGVGHKQISDMFIFEKHNTKIAIINVCENEWSTNCIDGAGANAIDPIANYYAIQSAKSKADKVVIISHGGHEYYSLPSPRMINLFRFFVDAGADAIINHHTHCISGYEVYRDSPIFYSLGNFVFDNKNIKDKSWNIGAAVKLKISGNEPIKFDFITFDQCSGDCTIKIHDEQKAIEVNKKLEELNKKIQDHQVLTSEFDNYIKDEEKLYRFYLEPHSSFIISYLQRIKLLPSFWSFKKKKYLFNLIRCESHRDIITEILKNENRNSL